MLGQMPSWETVCELGAELPEVEQAAWYGTPALKVRGKGFARLREDGALGGAARRPGPG
jgi:hypothetical protein